MQNLGSFRPLGAILGAPSHTKLDFAIPLLKIKGQQNLGTASESSSSSGSLEKKHENY